MKQGCHLIQECACAACAASVHTHIRCHELVTILIISEEYELGILSAKLHCSTSLRIESLYCCCICNNLLHKVDAECVCRRFSSRAAHSHAKALCRKQLLSLFEELIYSL